MMKKATELLSVASALLLTLALAACTGNNQPAAQPEATASSAVSSPETSASATADTGVAPTPAATAADPTASPSASTSARPEIQTFDLLEGGSNPITARLQQVDGYSLYVFEDFTFDASANRLSLTSNSGYYAEIEPLPSDFDIEKLRIEGNAELRSIGEVKDFSGELIEHPLGFADLYLQTSGDGGLQDYILWKSEGGESYIFRIHNPKGEAAGKFAGPVLVSLSTVAAN